MGIRCNLTTSRNMRGNMYRSGGGGSVVTIDPVYNSGIKIADYSIDGEEGAIFIPEINVTNLWINDNNYGVGTYTLSDDIGNYDFLEIYHGVYSEYVGSPYLMEPKIISVNACNFAHANSKTILITGFDQRVVYADIYDNVLDITTIGSNTILRINGIKC